MEIIYIVIGLGLEALHFIWKHINEIIYALFAGYLFLAADIANNEIKKLKSGIANLENFYNKEIVDLRSQVESLEFHIDSLEHEHFRKN